jgi:hypothetical protein
MPLSDQLKTELAYLTVYVLSRQPMSEGINRTFDMYIWPRLHGISPGMHLQHINQLLASEDSLEPWVGPTNLERTDMEIREYLERLSHAIEAEFQNTVRSESAVFHAGKWVCVDYPGNEVICQIGDKPPKFNNQYVVWKLEREQPKFSPMEAIRLEFQKFYLPKTMRGWIYKTPAKYAELSAPRLIACIDKDKFISLISLLKAMRRNRGHPVTKEIEQTTGFFWTSWDPHWAFFQALLEGIEMNLMRKI